MGISLEDPLSLSKPLLRKELQRNTACEIIFMFNLVVHETN